MPAKASYTVQVQAQSGSTKTRQAEIEMGSKDRFPHAQRVIRPQKKRSSLKVGQGPMGETSSHNSQSKTSLGNHYKTSQSFFVQGDHNSQTRLWVDDATNTSAIIRPVKGSEIPNYNLGLANLRN